MTQENKMQGIDVSANNGVMNWDKMHDIDFVILRGTIGLRGLDLRFKENISALVEKHVTLGVYHVFKPLYSGAAQADWLLKNVPLGPNYYMVDVENSYNMSPEMTAFELRSFVSRMQYLTKQLPYIYTAKYYWDAHVAPLYEDLFASCPLWVANYTIASEPEMPRTWKDYALWQYSDKGQLDWHIGNVDLNKGTLS